MRLHHSADTSLKFLALKATGAVQWVMVPPRGKLEKTKKRRHWKDSNIT